MRIVRGILHALRTPPPVRDRRGRRKLGLRVRLAGRCYRCNCLREVHGTLLFRRDIRLLTLSGGRDAAEDVNTRYHSWVWHRDGTYTFCALAWSSRRVDSSVCVTTESCGYARRTSRFQYGFCAGSDAAGRDVCSRRANHIWASHVPLVAGVEYFSGLEPGGGNRWRLAIGRPLEMFGSTARTSPVRENER